jgi:mono/diheme cytochrome c family protein
MPWNVFSALTDEDAESVVVYIRSLKPIKKAIPRVQETPELLESRTNTLAFEPAVKATPASELGARVGRGKYLATLAHCRHCHTPADAHGRRVPGLTFGGGRVGPGGAVAGNITPDPSGIANYNETAFIKMNRIGKVDGGRDLNPAMLWRFFGTMTDDDLKAIFAYLRTVPPVQHRVSTTGENTFCPLCLGKHGLGDQNVARSPEK